MFRPAPQYYSCKIIVCLCAFMCLWLHAASQASRIDISLDKDWATIATDHDKQLPALPFAVDASWTKVDVPHNWDSYEGYRRLLHGNRHGDSWYRKQFSIRHPKNNRRFFLFFEGVGSYATVFVNGRQVGQHAGGRTTFTVDITNAVNTDGTVNELAVHATHPSGIRDLPWVCGGCSDERGFSEGSQPMGIFRSVHLIITNDTRIVPFGIHAWSDIRNDKTLLNIDATIRNYSARNRNIAIINQLVDRNGKLVTETKAIQLFKANDSLTVVKRNVVVQNPELWSPEHPYLYKIITILKEGNTVIDRVETEFGFRTIKWNSPSHRFFINDQSLFINGIAEYEHLLGQSHAFSHEQVIARMKWIKSAGFNAFRDAHQPHNLLYGQLCDEKGILWWTQLSAHIWYNTPEFRNNFKQLLKEWVIERRNNPSVILWGLQNESQLPEDFAKECTQLIRELDPTASSQRLVTTCNGGSGTDWDVPQNWTGTYGGDPATYASDLKKQVLAGEYGAWRTIDLHTEGGFVQNGILSEDRMTQLMEQKVRLAESVKDSVAGQFFWLLTSHDNPGRVQGGEGLRELDRIGPVNYKGLLTPWEEPLDVYYMFRSNYASKEKDPMVYIVSHTWPDRWTEPGKKNGIIVYSNCDEVELFNDVNGTSLGKRKRGGTGTHFSWNGVDIKYNVLYAVGYVNGKIAAKDTIVLHYLPKAPHFERLNEKAQPLTKPVAGYNYIYRINCGGPDYTDENGNRWMADRSLGKGASDSLHSLISSNWGSFSWADDFPGMNSFFASQRRRFAHVKNSKDWSLFNDFRYGKNKLGYEFPLPNGDYLVELYFIEPWLGVGSNTDCSGMRLFDVAINGKTVLPGIDIWKEAGTSSVLKKMVRATVRGGKMIISFPKTNAGQAIISAIAIASLNKNIKPAPSLSLVADIEKNTAKQMTWLDAGDRVYAKDNIHFRALPSGLYGADWLQFSAPASARSGNCTSFKLLADADVFVAWNKPTDQVPGALAGFEDIKSEIETDELSANRYEVYRKRFRANSVVRLCAPMMMLQPATQMQPAYDLKTVTAYRANVVALSEGAVKEQFGGRESAVVKSNNRVVLDWPVQTGVADIYSFTIKYYYPKDTLRAKVQLLDAGNTMMLEEPVNFTFTRPGKWNSITFNTGSMINAGNYKVRVIVEKGEELVVSGIDMQ